MTNIISSYIIDPIASRLRSFGVGLGDMLYDTSQRVKDVVTSPQGIIGIGLGVGMHQILTPLVEKVVKALSIHPNPFRDLSLTGTILMAPITCILAPVMEEKMFRGDLQEISKKKFESFNASLGFSDSVANIAARVMSVFFVTIIFGLIHFSNAIFARCHPVHFLPQAIVATIAGLMLGIAKEFSGGLSMPIGMHIGNNTLHWGLLLARHLGKIKTLGTLSIKNT